MDYCILKSISDAILMKNTLEAIKVLNALTDWIEPIYGYQEARSIALMILERKFGFSRDKILSGRQVSISIPDVIPLNDILSRLCKNEPIQYILGEAFFYDRWFRINPSVLIPRPETEELCRMILEENRSPMNKILDIGTGSGCIAITLALQMDQAEVYGWDISEPAIRVAEENARLYQARVKFSILDIVSYRGPGPLADIVVCNPPYVTDKEAALMNKNVLDHEPREALFSGDDPLKFHKSVMSLKKILLKSGGRIYFEINESSGDDARVLFSEHGMKEIRIVRDIHGKNRFACGGL